MSLAFYFFLVCYKQLAAPIGQDLSCYPSTIDVLPSQCLSYSTALFLNLCILGQYSHLPYKIYIYMYIYLTHRHSSKGDRARRQLAYC